MSQEKVEKRKYEKLHRKEIEKKRKIKKALGVLAAILVLGIIVGFPLGLQYYNNHKDTSAATATEVNADLQALQNMIATATVEATTEAGATTEAEATTEAGATTEAETTTSAE